MYGLYIHIPYCVSKCRYCDFVSAPGTLEEQARYAAAVIREMECYRGTAVDTVFFGGGTPTALPPELLRRLLSAVCENFCLAESMEFSVEANPRTLDREKLSLLREYGVNRLSIGVQSFQDRELRWLGRAHCAKDAKNTVALAREYFDNINLDIMTAIPEQTVSSLTDTLRTAVSFLPAHLSCYSLIIEEGTPFYQAYAEGKLPLPGEDLERELYYRTEAMLKEQGYLQYEISNYAKPGYVCRHNIKYWECREYIGLGAAAHSYQGNRRFFNPHDVAVYIADPLKKIEEEALTPEAAMSEFMFMGLRMNRGVGEEDFYQRFGKPLAEVFSGPIKKQIQNGLLEYCDGRYRLTERGKDLANTVMCAFLS